MAKIAVILPHHNLAAMIQQIVLNMDMNQITIIDYDDDHTKIPELVERARSWGADIILTRGLTALVARRCSNISIVEMRITAQELGMAIKKGKESVFCQTPIIALIGSENMFCDFSQIENLFEVKLRPYLIKADCEKPYLDTERNTIQAIEDGADIIIGGRTACAVAKARNIVNVFLTATSDSIRESLRVARRISFAIDREKNSSVEVQTILESSFSLLFRFNKEGYITNLNRTAIDRLDEKPHRICGRHILSIIKGISRQQLMQTLNAGKNQYLTFVMIGSERFAANLLPIRTTPGLIIGGVLACDEITRLDNISDSNMEQRHRLCSADHSFKDFDFQTTELKKLRVLAERFAYSDAHVQLQCDPGCFPQILAECIHNAGDRQNMPFVSVNCRELSSAEQVSFIFGDGGQMTVSQSACALAHTGTLFLQNSECLCSQAKERLLHMIVNKTILNAQNGRSYPVDVRVITATELSDSESLICFRHHQELGIILRGLQLKIPPLSHDSNHVDSICMLFLKRYMKRHQRMLSLTDGGKQWVRTQKWPGNYMQMDRFCERLVLTSPKNSVNERILKDLYTQFILCPLQGIENNIPLSSHPEAKHIKAVLEKHNGNRKASANELGMSTSTLWRKINKYGIQF